MTGSGVPFASIEPAHRFDPVPMVPLQTTAVLVIGVTMPELTATTRVTGGALAPAASVGAAAYVQVTVPLAPSQPHPVPEAETKLSPAGRMSWTWGAIASDGPRLPTFMV